MKTKLLKLFALPKRVWLAIVRWSDKQENLQGRLMSVQAARGKWRVIYNDGKRSQRMCWATAKDYAEMFGGTVVHARYEAENV